MQQEALELGVPRARGEEGIERTKASHASSGPAKDHTPTMPLYPGTKGPLRMTLRGMVFLALPAASPPATTPGTSHSKLSEPRTPARPCVLMSDPFIPSFGYPSFTPATKMY